MPSSASVVLIGPMGAGKSTIGRLLAEKLSLPFIDMDQLIEDRTGADIQWIFDVEGESGFRDREESLLKELLELSSPHVIATGGGVVERPGNRLGLVGQPLVVYLQTSVDQLVARTAKDKKRPLLQTENREQRVREIFQRRDPLYREVAKYVVATGVRSPRQVSDDIAEYVEKVRLG